MSKSELIKLSGWAFIAGALGFVTILSNSDLIAFPEWVISWQSGCSVCALVNN